MEEALNDRDTSTTVHFKITKGGYFEPANITVSTHFIPHIN